MHLLSSGNLLVGLMRPTSDVDARLTGCIACGLLTHTVCIAIRDSFTAVPGMLAEDRFGRGSAAAAALPTRSEGLHASMCLRAHTGQRSIVNLGRQVTICVDSGLSEHFACVCFVCPPPPKHTGERLHCAQEHPRLHTHQD
jgi:hypothetical protein